MSKPSWTTERIADLRSRYGPVGPTKLAKEWGMSRTGVQFMAHKLGLRVPKSRLSMEAAERNRKRAEAWPIDDETAALCAASNAWRGPLADEPPVAWRIAA